MATSTMMRGRLSPKQPHSFAHSYDEKKKKDVPVLVFLDCNFPDPFSTIPSLLKDRRTGFLNWRTRFMFYHKIVVFRFHEKYSYDYEKHARRLQFAMDVID